MQPLTILLPRDPRRGAAERLIADVFHSRYGARISKFPEVIAARFSVAGQPVCAAGLRFAKDGFFSEQYLDARVEETLARLCGCDVLRDEVFEVTSLASHDHRGTAGFLRAVVRHGQATGHAWSFFTLTDRLYRMLLQIGILPTFIAPADRERIAEPCAWGTYYDHAPAVYAVRDPAHLTICVSSTGAAHAISI